MGRSATEICVLPGLFLEAAPDLDLDSPSDLDLDLPSDLPSDLDLDSGRTLEGKKSIHRY